MSGQESAREFEVRRELDRGGFGSVYQVLVRHKDGFSHVAAVKLLHSKWSDNEEIACRMRDEARLLGLLRHRNIVHVMDLTSIDGRTAIVMEYLEAIHLKIAIDDLNRRGESMPVRAAVEVAASAAAALDAAFNRPPHPNAQPLRVVHRDIKPPNIKLDESGLVKVLDFGVARAEFAGRESETHQLQFGSIDYMAPERLLFEAEGPESDVYSLGSTLFEALSGEKLGRAKRVLPEHETFISDRLSFLRAIRAVPGHGAVELEELLRKSLAFEEEERPSAQELAQSLRQFGRSLAGISLAEWAESEVPGLLKSFVSQPGRESSFVGQAFHEDETRALAIPTVEPKESDPQSHANAPGVPPDNVALDPKNTSVQDIPESSQPAQPPRSPALPTGSPVLPPGTGSGPKRPNIRSGSYPNRQGSTSRPRKRDAPTPLDVLMEMGGILAATLLPQQGPLWISLVLGGLVSFGMGLLLSSLVLLPLVRLSAHLMVLVAGGTDSAAIVDFHQRYLWTGGFSCEIPLLVVLLDRTGRITAEFLARHRFLLLAISLVLAWWVTPRVELSAVLPLAFWIWGRFELGIRGARRRN